MDNLSGKSSAKQPVRIAIADADFLLGVAGKGRLGGRDLMRVEGRKRGRKRTGGLSRLMGGFLTFQLTPLPATSHTTAHMVLLEAPSKRHQPISIHVGEIAGSASTFRRASPALPRTPPGLMFEFLASIIPIPPVIKMYGAVDADNKKPAQVSLAGLSMQAQSKLLVLTLHQPDNL